MLFPLPPHEREPLNLACQCNSSIRIESHTARVAQHRSCPGFRNQASSSLCSKSGLLCRRPTGTRHFPASVTSLSLVSDVIALFLFTFMDLLSVCLSVLSGRDDWLCLSTGVSPSCFFSKQILPRSPCERLTLRLISTARFVSAAGSAWCCLSVSAAAFPCECGHLGLALMLDGVFPVRASLASQEEGNSFKGELCKASVLDRSSTMDRYCNSSTVSVWFKPFVPLCQA